MKFTTPCFVRVEDAGKRKELIEWLESIGYKVHDFTGDYIAVGHKFMPQFGKTVTNEEAAELSDMEIGISARYNCGTNIDLFKALAAMNEENDCEQWFICYDALTECRYLIGDMYKHTVENRGCVLGIGAYVRKATVAEIVKYIKNK